MGIEEEGDPLNAASTQQNPDSVENGGTATRTTSGSQSDKAWLARIWGGFDTKYMKPLLTHSKPTLVETLPSCCLPLAKMLTSSEQLNQDNMRTTDSDIELCIDDTESRSDRFPSQPGYERMQRTPLEDGFFM